MALTTYKQKRSFSKTPEPVGGKAAGNAHRFVIQKHDASRLHYDFRLEMEGVLKSWAVPKGPSMDPDIKRLAMMVEDHPYDYRGFEGIIPKGQYGGGTVIVWDEGEYEAAGDSGTDKKTRDKALRQQLSSGKLKIILKGKKLKGEFALVKAKGKGDNAWLLMKLKDRHAATTDITLKEKSVLSGKTLKQIEANPPKVYGKATTNKTKSKKENSRSLKKTIALPAAVKTTGSKKSSPGASAGKKARFPAAVQPMLATLVDKPFDEEGWLYEVKWDGYRAIGHSHKGKVSISSRNSKSFDEKFYPIHQALQEWGANVVVDGEIIVADDKGLADFGKLQNWRSEADGELKYYLFDLLWVDGYSLMHVPLTERKAMLKNIIPESDTLILSENFEASGTEFFHLAEKMGLEGIIAKKADSPYTPGARSREWLKIKTASRQEMVIGGFTNNIGSAKSFSSLLVGIYEKNKLVYTGKIGTGFSDARQKEMMELFKPLITKTSPFAEEPDINKPSRFRSNPPRAEATWLKPKLVCEVSFREMTTDGVMRHPSFEGMREDKKATEVTRETATATASLVSGKTVLHTKKIIRETGKKERKTLLNPTDETQVKEINGHTLKFTNLSKLYWPKEKISKRDMLNYYYQVAPYMLPYMKGRPQSLNRHPNGINGMSFYQKDVKGKVPDWVQTFPYRSEGDRTDKEFMVCSNEASILYIASLGCIEMNPWSSTVDAPDNPDWCIIDLDPDKNPFDQVIETAKVTKQVLDAAGVNAFCKTSGSTGIHIYIPLGARYSYEHSKEFARLIVQMVHDELPRFTSIERATARRKGKLYLDFMQNRPQATLATAYSLRPKPGATVSMPLYWEEVKKGLKMTDFTIQNAVARLRSEGDIFKPVLGKGIDMQKAVKKLTALMT